MQERLIMIHQELPSDLWNHGPPIPDINSNEFPEEKLQPKLEITEEEIDSQDEEVQSIIKQPKAFENGRQILPCSTKLPSRSEGYFTLPVPTDVLERVFEQPLDNLMGRAEDADTPIDTCMRVRRLNKLLYLQDQIVVNMNTEISEFNASIEELKKEKIPVHAAGDLIDLHILTLNQELNILKIFEDNEYALSAKVTENLKLVHDLEDQIEDLISSKDKIEADTETAKLEENKIQEKFKHATENNKFYDFLRKVFKKKYRPPKEKHDDDSSSESSSSSSSDESDEDDDGSIDSRDFGFIRQDLNTCPKGCELAIYNFTVNLRSKRHEIEQFLREQNRQLEIANKNIELSRRKLGILKTQLQASQVDLENFQREKQRLMNQVMCTVVLNLDQITAFSTNEFDINNFLVFSKTELTSLYKRVGVLQHEDYEQKYTYDIYMKHITRLKKDLAYMKQKLHCLKMKMKMIMESKFGKVIDINEIEMAIIKKNFHHTPINELEEVVLKKLVYDVRIKLTDIKSMFASELNLWIAKGAKAQNELIEIIKENTKRLDVLQLISREKKDLTKMVSQQPKKYETVKKMEQVHSDSLEGIEKLEAVLDSQMKQMQELKTEIKLLKTKGLALRPKPEEKVERMSDTVETGDAKGWMDIDKYVDQEDEESEEKHMQEITLPGYYSNEAEDIIRDLLSDILDKTNTKLSVTSIINNILSGIMRCTSVNEIVEEIINNLPITPTVQQKYLINVSSEKIFSVNDLEASEESIVQCAYDLVAEVIEEVLNMDFDEPHELVLETAEKLVETIPPEYIFQEHSLEILTKKMSDSIGEQIIDKQALMKSVEEIQSQYKDQMMDIINVILARVFSTGLDYLFVVENK